MHKQGTSVIQRLSASVIHVVPLRPYRLPPARQTLLNIRQTFA